MKTAREWFEKLRPDLRDRAIKATKKQFAEGRLNREYHLFSDSLFYSFVWSEEEGYPEYESIWCKIYWDAVDIEEGRKPDIKPKKL